MTVTFDEKRDRFLAAAADLPARCRLVEGGEGNPIARKLRKLRVFGARYAVWAAARAGLHPGLVDVPLFWGGRMRLPYSEDSDFTTLYLAGVPAGPEYKLVRWLVRTLKPSDVFYDAGANYGFYTMLAAEFAREVHAFEPMPEVHGWLRRNAPQTAVTVDAALWDQAGSATLYLHRIGNVCNTLEAEVADADPSRGSNRVEVRCTTLDDYAREHAPPSVIKIDVEGGERRLLAGGLSTLRNARPIIAIEAWGGANGERFSLPAFKLLLDLGYRAHALAEDGTTRPLPASELPAYVKSLPGVWDNLIFVA